MKYLFLIVISVIFMGCGMEELKPSVEHPNMWVCNKGMSTYYCATRDECAKICDGR